MGLTPLSSQESEEVVMSSSTESSPSLLVTVPTFAKQVSASPATVRGWIAMGMPALRVDRHWRIEVEAALTWLRSKSRGTSNAP